MTSENICVNMNMSEAGTVAQVCQSGSVMPISENNSVFFGTPCGVSFFAFIRFFGYFIYYFYSFYRLSDISSTAIFKCKNQPFLKCVA